MRRAAKNRGKNTRPPARACAFPFNSRYRRGCGVLGGGPLPLRRGRVRSRGGGVRFHRFAVQAGEETLVEPLR